VLTARVNSDLSFSIQADGHEHNPDQEENASRIGQQIVLAPVVVAKQFEQTAQERDDTTNEKHHP
jgi:hypothetical protein